MPADLPPGFVGVGPGVFEGPRSKVGPGVYRGLVRVQTGPVDPDDDHDCDAMGCGSAVDHVLSRTIIPGMTGGPYTADEYLQRNANQDQRTP